MPQLKAVSLWQDTHVIAAKAERLTADREADVCVIGAGIGGVTTAYLLAKAGKKVIVLEMGELGQGETALTSAHLASALDEGFIELVNLFGERGSKLAVKSHVAAIEQIADIVETEKIDCDFKYVPGYLFFDDEQKDELEKELKAAKTSGLKAQRINALPTGQFHNKIALEFAKQAQFHPLKYLDGVIQAAQKLGVVFYTQARALDVEELKTKVLVRLEGERKVLAKQVVVATNTPFCDRVTMHTKQAAYRSYIVVADVSGIDADALFWDTADPYHYVRFFQIGDKKLAIIGGEDHKTGQDTTNADLHYEILYAWALQYFPTLGKIKYQWSGQIMEPIDGLAYLGLNPGNKRIYIITGDSGHGLTHGTIGGMIIRDLITNHKNPWVGLYNPARKNIKAAGTFLKEGLNMAVQYSAYLKKDEARHISPNSGAVVSEKGKKVAIFCDAKGVMHRCSAICPHLGCIVDWNDNEKSWDCPCHGSRFDAKGKLLNGPATIDLPQL